MQHYTSGFFALSPDTSCSYPPLSSLQPIMYVETLLTSNQTPKRLKTREIQVARWLSNPLIPRVLDLLCRCCYSKDFTPILSLLKVATNPSRWPQSSRAHLSVPNLWTFAVHDRFRSSRPFSAYDGSRNSFQDILQFLAMVCKAGRPFPSSLARAKRTLPRLL